MAATILHLLHYAGAAVITTTSTASSSRCWARGRRRAQHQYGGGCLRQRAFTHQPLSSPLNFISPQSLHQQPGGRQPLPCTRPRCSNDSAEAPERHAPGAGLPLPLSGCIRLHQRRWRGGAGGGTSAPSTPACSARSSRRSTATRTAASSTPGFITMYMCREALRSRRAAPLQRRIRGRGRQGLCRLLTNCATASRADAKQRRGQCPHQWVTDMRPAVGSGSLPGERPQRALSPSRANSVSSRTVTATGCATSASRRWRTMNWWCMTRRKVACSSTA